MLTDAVQKVLNSYAEAVVNAPHSLSLTATRDVEQFHKRHIADGLLISSAIPEDYQRPGLKLVDVGTGNGVPGLVVAIVHPDWRVNLVEANAKKCGFLDAFCLSHGIKNVTVTSGRAEELARQPNFRSSFEVALARALGSLPTTFELVLPLVKTGGLLIVPHGTSHLSELDNAKNAMELLGGQLRNIRPYVLDAITFFHLCVNKVRETPDLYPRRTGLPAHKPL